MQKSMPSAVEQRRYGRFIFVENTIRNFPKSFCFSSICKFGSFQNPFAMITSLSELCFRYRRIIVLVQLRKVISMNHGRGQAAENHGNE